ncbi:glutathione S-transferase domain-containing protein [Alcanivorax balearicus MACL04]|uniref:Glutathione S-transferase domain-containing protein n=1 Tax=Alloalcanivorax balearicus MACL04 TaxID=1177182 RepID=A0ABT2R029_9GAMM|nr:glutathione S-transferase family protein [Alloalcanivorax balearicus]MCU5783142.1 glutathione S-transferase domain-containing protein [Alloalcanivorax balearicus MACL04]
MSQDLVFYTNPMSRARVARWMLEEVNQPYRTHVLSFGLGMRDADYLAINPMGKVPALVHGDTVVTEVSAICTYLADAFPQAGLAPAPASRERGAYYRWLFFIAGPFDAACTNHVLGFEIGNDAKKAATAGYGTLDRVLNTLENELRWRDYLVGKRFTAADLLAGAYLGYEMAVGAIEKRPVFERYCANLMERPAAIKAQQIDNDLASHAV